MEELYTPQEVAKMLKVSLRAVYKWFMKESLNQKDLYFVANFQRCFGGVCWEIKWEWIKFWKTAIGDTVFIILLFRSRITGWTIDLIIQV